MSGERWRGGVKENGKDRQSQGERERDDRAVET